MFFSMSSSIKLRKHYLRYHRLIQVAGLLLTFLGPFFCLRLYQTTQDLGLVIVLLLVFVFLGFSFTTPYIFLHRFKAEGVDLGGELLRWEHIERIEKTNNTIVFHGKNGVQATLKTPLNLLDVSESLRVMTDIYLPLEEKITHID